MSGRKKKPCFYTKEDHVILRKLFVQYGVHNRYRRYEYWENVCEEFNAVTKNTKRSSTQIRNYFQNNKRKIIASATQAQKNHRDVNPLNSLSPSKKTSTSLSPYIGSTEPDYRSLADDLPKSWEYTEIGAGYLHNEQGSSNRDPEPDEQQHIFDDVIDFSLPRSTSDFGKNGMSQDLVNILADQARQHHKLKVKLLNEKFRKLTETHKTKMWMLESEHEMKRKQHEQKMENLILKYKKIKESLVE